MKFFLTYAASDGDVGSSPGWHASVILSTLDNEKGGKLEVIDNYGFYGLPTTKPEPVYWKSLLKKNVKRLDLDFEGNHGILRHEKIRELDRGCGLHGITYELDEEAFRAFQKKCQDDVEAQNKAIEDIVSANHFSKKEGKISEYDYEHLGPLIFAIELALSKQENRPPRLHPFELKLTLGLGGPSVATSNSCKSRIINLLRGTLSEDEIAELTHNGKHPTVPRFSGKMERIALHSEGPLSTFQKEPNHEIYFRDGKDPAVKLYWTVLPHELRRASAETQAQFLFNAQYDDQVKPLVKKLQALEWFFQQPEKQLFPEKWDLEEFQAILIERIRQCYVVFASVPPGAKQQELEKCASWSGRQLYSLFSLPRYQREKEYCDYIESAKQFLKMVDFFINDGCEFDLDSLEAGYQTDTIDNDEILSLVSQLSPANQQKICKIMRRSYMPLPCPVQDEASPQEGQLTSVMTVS